MIKKEIINIVILLMLTFPAVPISASDDTYFTTPQLFGNISYSSQNFFSGGQTKATPFMTRAEFQQFHSNRNDDVEDNGDDLSYFSQTWRPEMDLPRLNLRESRSQEMELYDVPQLWEANRFNLSQSQKDVLRAGGNMGGGTDNRIDEVPVGDGLLLVQLGIVYMLFIFLRRRIAVRV